jgi:hypothetical protein
MKPHGPIQVVKKWHGMRADPVLLCLDDPEGLNNGYLPSEHNSQVCELAKGLRLGTTVSSHYRKKAFVPRLFYVPRGRCS